MIFRVPDNHNTSAAGFNLTPFGDGFLGIVCSLGLEVGSNFADDGANVIFRKDDDGIDIFKRGQNFSAFFSRHYGTAFSFKMANRVVRIYSYY